MTDQMAAPAAQAAAPPRPVPESRALRRALTPLVLLLAAGLFVYHARIYWSWTEDDAFISFRYAQNAARGHGFVFNPGERVEGYSNFAWVLLATAAIRAGQDPVGAAKVAGIVAGLGALFLAWMLARRLVPRAGLTALVAPLYLAISPVLVQHSVSGLETSVFAFLLVAAVLLAAAPPRPAVRAGLLATLLLLSLTRPEGPFVALVLLAVRGLESRLVGGWAEWAGEEAPDPVGVRAVPSKDARVERAARVDFGLFLVLFAGYFLWRWHYFGAPFPNTFYAKARGGTHGLIDGAQYTLDFLRDGGGALFFALGLVPLALGVRRPVYGLALAASAVYVGFVLASGGDWMFHYRFYAHLLPVLAAMLAAGLDMLLAIPRPGSLRALFVYGLVSAALVATLMSVGNTELRVARIVLPALARHNYLSQNYEELGLWFRDNTPPEATVAISDVGAVGYFSERRILDMFGLIDPHIARLAGRMHYKADANYVLGRRPDYIVLVSLNDNGAGYSFQRIPDWSMHAQPAFHAEYELVRTEPQYWQDEFVLVYRRRMAE